jgi:glycosyltransferase involved in cell wall biosynthesis
LIAASQETIDQGVARGLSAARFRLVPYGVKAPVGTPEYSRKDLEKLLNREIQGTVLLTLGRLVKRKGVSWFVGAVMSRLADSTVYIVAGGGEERASIAESARRAGIGDRVFLLGAVADEVKELLYATSDIFVQSNIAVPGDMEGFGLVVLEAASYGLPVVASNLEGLKDAIRDGQSGFLVAPGDADAYVRKLDELTRDPTGRKRFGQGAREYVIANMSWGQVADRYLAVCKEALASHEGINGPQTS